MKNEIELLYKSYTIIPANKDTSTDVDLVWLVNNLNSSIGFERPDAYIVHDKIAFCIEHFRVSIYKHNAKGDIKQVASSKLNRRNYNGNINKDVDYEFDPDISNLQLSFVEALSNHMRFSREYKENVKNVLSTNDYQYRLVIILEDQSTSASYINSESNIPVNPLLLDAFSYEVLKYESVLWGVIYVGGDNKTKTLYAYTLDEITEKKETGGLLNIKDYRSLIDKESLHISEDNPEEDVHTVTIRLTEHS